jgi:hypothetical protein
VKYHIFIGSTLDDLKNERKELVRIVMELGHIPVMADYLDETARNAPKLLQKIIEECDYFIALTAHKYKSAGGEVLPLIAESAIAANKGIPVLGLVIEEKARWKPVKKEKDPSLVHELNNFKDKLRDGPCESWLNTPDLCQKAQTLLIQEMCINARPGWVKADRVIEPNVANELSRLSSENTVLRRRFYEEDKAIALRLQDDHKHILKLLAANKVSLSFYYSTGQTWENTRQFRAVRIFKLLVPELLLGKSTAEISRFLGTVLNSDLDKTIRKEYPTPSNTIKKIMADFSALKLVWCVNNGEVKTGDEIWEITDYGMELYSAYRMRQLEKAIVKRE